jgi:hypothetical protein
MKHFTNFADFLSFIGTPTARKGFLCYSPVPVSFLLDDERWTYEIHEGQPAFMRQGGVA